MVFLFFGLDCDCELSIETTIRLASRSVLFQCFGKMNRLLSLKDILKPSDVTTDNGVFRLHYKVTATILIGFSILVSSSLYFGDPISCISKDDVPKKVLDTFCWIHSTFSLESAWQKKVGEEVPYPGVDKYTPGEIRIYHAYYQWVCFVLFLQSVLFYVPRYFWKAMESGRLKAILLEIENPERNEGRKLECLARYVVSCFHHNESYFACYLIAEILNVFNVLGQVFLVNTFLGNSFTIYGIRVIEFSEWDFALRYDPMIRVFPRMTKCTFHRFGSSGDVQRLDAMCILPINIINEKIYVFLWFWLIVLSSLSILAVVYRIVMYLSPSACLVMLRCKSQMQSERLNILICKCSAGDWFFISLLAKNLDSDSFRYFIIYMMEMIRKSDESDEV